MKILVIGSGGREHAIVWKLRQSLDVKQMWCAPGNGGISKDTECIPLDVKNVSAAAELALQLKADLTIVGPEVPLVNGIADEFARSGLAVLGPQRKAAQLEGSKVFAKRFMQRHGIPTAKTYGVFSDCSEAEKKLNSVPWPLVIKADGLCAGKGVLVTSSQQDATQFIDRLMNGREFQEAGSCVLLEEALIGEELSYIVLTDGEKFIPMAPARDHKRAFDNDEGPNTGGMGAYSTSNILPAMLEAEIIRTIVEPTLRGLREEGMPYRGFLYFGLMLTANGPQVLEYNCRLGDPEAEAVLMRANFDFAQACAAAARGSVGEVKAEWFPGASVCIVMASKGYPSNPEIGRKIEGLDAAAQVPGAVILHAGTKREADTFYTTGGRVLVVSARGESLDQACRTAYDAISRIHIDGAFYRRDIGVRAAKQGSTGY